MYFESIHFSLDVVKFSFLEHRSNIPRSSLELAYFPLRQAEDTIRSFRWAPTENYSPCNATCGQAGKQTRTYICEQVTFRRTTGKAEEVIERSDDQFCAKAEKPETETKACIGDPCPVTTYFQWLVSETWSDCPCGEDSKQTRNVTCQKVTSEKTSGGEVKTRENADSFKCKKLSRKPETSRPCPSLPCQSIHFQWYAPEVWPDCPCGKNSTQTRNVTCQKITTTKMSGKKKETVEETDLVNCDRLLGKPAISRLCHGLPCPPIYKWHATDKWGECKAACGLTGKQIRLYSCKETSQNGQVVDVKRNQCKHISKPNAESKSCEGPPCPLQWSIGFWSQCSVSCGMGKRYRKVYCGDPETDKDDFLCKNDPPATSKKCVLKACPELQDENCTDMYSFCSAYRALRFRCKRSRFRRKCCKTCSDDKRSMKRKKTSVRQRGMWRYFR
ncbi:A disintegrin and metalloproteinase with thrombospondin motifs 3 [Plakobranchus ocellatus]|uniref:A disintegrin and metalloproteinase with thrombospondin motifs 3 n=1 Tax=Plakobranchus ocellatus TaxID=259542 RepID=A0AAV4AZK5_9GAST|nr:A disintegrin and metalloproteinase with thrombospondin motifs 3 [Plakobranchus ocellatus]